MLSFKKYLKESLFKSKWPEVFPADIKIFIRKNNIKLKKDKKYNDIFHGYINQEHVFSYDNEKYVLYSDFSPIMFRNGSVKSQIN